MSENKIGEILICVASIALGALIAAVPVEFIVYPICFGLFHDCGKKWCGCSPDYSWNTYWICFAICFVLIGLLILLTMNNEVTYTSRRPSRRNGFDRLTNHSGSSVETDFFDEDVEGAPGAYGFDR